jgi:hypothetical protein
MISDIAVEAVPTGGLRVSLKTKGLSASFDWRPDGAMRLDFTVTRADAALLTALLLRSLTGLEPQPDQPRDE